MRRNDQTIIRASRELRHTTVWNAFDIENRSNSRHRRLIASEQSNHNPKRGVEWVLGDVAGRAARFTRDDQQHVVKRSDLHATVRRTARWPGKDRYRIGLE